MLWFTGFMIHELEVLVCWPKDIFLYFFEDQYQWRQIPTFHCKFFLIKCLSWHIAESEIWRWIKNILTLLNYVIPNYHLRYLLFLNNMSEKGWQDTSYYIRHFILNQFLKFLKSPPLYHSSKYETWKNLISLFFNNLLTFNKKPIR